MRPGVVGPGGVRPVAPGRRGEHGAAVLLAVALVGVLALVALTASAVVAVVATHRVAQSAADLAALAAARAVQDGEDACGTADRYARRNGAALVECVVSGWEVEVRVGADAELLPGGRTTLEARARAGPVGSEEAALR